MADETRMKRNNMDCLFLAVEMPVLLGLRAESPCAVVYCRALHERYRIEVLHDGCLIDEHQTKILWWPDPKGAADEGT